MISLISRQDIQWFCLSFCLAIFNFFLLGGPTNELAGAMFRAPPSFGPALRLDGRLRRPPPHRYRGEMECYASFVGL